MTITYGDWRAGEGRPRHCNGGQHVVPLPIHMTLADVLTELTTMGQLVESPATDEDVEWVVVDCPGGEECWCQHGLLHPDFRAYDDDVQVYGPPEDQN